MPQEIAPTSTAADYARLSLSPATLRAYRADWTDFTAWCQGRGVSPLPAAPNTVADYLASLALTHGRSALKRRLSAIGQAHRLKEAAWIPSHPLIRHALRGILRQHGRPTRKAAALATADIHKLVATCDPGLTGQRDRAMILLGFAGALRRSELVGIKREHLTFTTDGLRLHLPRSKSDQTGEGAEIGIPRGTNKDTCPVRAMERWLETSQCQYGPVFRKIDMWGSLNLEALRPNAVRVMLRQRAQKAGIQAGPLEAMSAHGLRAGFIHSAYVAGVPDEAIMAHSRHKDHATMRGYVRRARLLTESPVKKLGL